MQDLYLSQSDVDSGLQGRIDVMDKNPEISIFALRHQDINSLPSRGVCENDAADSVTGSIDFLGTHILYVITASFQK